MNAKIVLIDDEVKLLKALKRALESDGHEVFDFTSPTEALNFIQTRSPDLIVSDIRMPGLTGLDLLEKLTTSESIIPCILMTAYSSIETAVSAMKLGARDYLLKPFELKAFKDSIKNVLAQDKTPVKQTSENILLGNSEPIKKILEIIEKVAETESTVLLRGESGTGKELAARILHSRSSRANKPFLAVNCSTLPESLFESEMFGHVKGSFTGAICDKQGLFTEAEGGTVFLDEIGDLALANQAKLLRILQDGSLKKVGENKILKADVRVLSATNRDLQADVKTGKFREDLLYRLNVVEIYLPPLRERIQDIPLLTDYFLDKFAKKHHRPVIKPSGDFITVLQSYSWPGNVRELENVVERAIILKKGENLHAEDVLIKNNSEISDYSSSIEMTLGDALEKVEAELIVKMLRSVQWNFSKGAEKMGITRQNLHYKLKKYGIKKESSQK
ncbi:MAG: sigma-54-dependent Fis family transcriptional regulator [Candidatus Riflebacteria bacterium]|nr:sigma-54-dependent Fis family transcriptional regulator [Candidatus Riflebacteria bacterium]